jgi:AraC-like DNA-binding protein
MHDAETAQVLAAPLAGLSGLRLDSRRAFPRHWHDVYGIGLIDRGAQRSASGRGPVEALAGELISVNPGEVHDGVPFDALGRSWRMVYLEPPLLRELAAELAGRAAGDIEITRPVLADAQLAARFEHLFAGLSGGSALHCEERLLALVELLLRRHSTAAPCVLRDAPVARARERLLDDPGIAPSLAELAHEAGLSRFQLLRGFARAYGLPPHAYLLQCRLSRARRLIAKGQGLADAAAASGFADQSHMSRAFRRFLGVTPGAYGAAFAAVPRNSVQD